MFSRDLGKVSMVTVGSLLTMHSNMVFVGLWESPGYKGIKDSLVDVIMLTNATVYQSPTMSLRFPWRWCYEAMFG